MAKRAAQGAGSIRQRSDGTWEARYTVGRDPGTGKQVQRSIYGKTQAEVRKKLAKVSTELDEGIYKDPCDITVGEWLDVWLAEYNNSIKPYTRRAYEMNIRVHLKPGLGKVKLTALTVPMVQRFYNQKLDALSPKSIKNLNGILHSALKQAVAIGYIRTNPADNVSLPKSPKAEIKPLDSKQIKEFLHAIKGHKYERLYIVALFTGMREGELLGLTWDCVDFEKGQILVKHQLQKRGTTRYFAPLKNNKTRTITPAALVMQALAEEKRKQIIEKTVAAELWEPIDVDNLVFTNEFGKYLVVLTVYKNYKRIMKDLGLSDKRLHDLRHSYAVAALVAGDDIKTVQENMGHHSAAFTLDVYGHVTEEMKQESAKRMDSFISNLYG